jgi:hypothetical protein
MALSTDDVLAQGDLQTLEKRLAELQSIRDKGVKGYRFASGDMERSLDFRSDTELRTAIVDLERRIARMKGAAPVATIHLTTSKGIES